MHQELNYKHLYYFWVTAKEGGMSHAADRLGLAVQTVSAQVRLLEQSLGHALFKPAGRGLALTDAGQAALQVAEQIFHLGEHLHTAVREAGSHTGVRLVVGISDGLPKLAVRDLLTPAMEEPNLRLLCHEDKFDDLLADLALHRLDVVLSDRPAPANPNLRLYSHALGSSAMGWYAPPQWLAQARHDFPHNLAHMPVLLPTAHASVRLRLDQWFERQGVTPHVVGEFEDSALLATFGSSGMGVFPASERMREKLSNGYGLRWFAPCDGVQEHFYAIGTARKVQHPLVQKLLVQKLSD
ncbi:MAG: LysR family transcriptional regulator [Hydrogenophaga sp.]|jgi:LysR family transcriptional activator of nhaA|uniref:LysR family transcriptional regulator n=1 Tax=Hydrogenophaga sp. TaxID=1904254 RepID=UPI002722907C|nr:LysR family transcriptional regulator [Hydrogenophaga sp.]MDO9568723.1 LysR family transcriptional regulator [Hydrogenophaga sp.]MDP1895628.1 LysR family transcriptional regulator [Hydrogenophaga sp.]MDP3372616.1 LysR family transcriptional regulator [Hydrogenophaga sp.]MDZ4237047.1 LysR family transcriptional regulator [Hydrogenophaga sp.]